jgi:hypothetical protein
MARLDTSEGASELATVLPGFEPMQALWQGDAPVFPSESAARWFLKTRRAQLVATESLALYRGCMCLHREKLIELLRRDALSAARNRYMGVGELQA